MVMPFLKALELRKTLREMEEFDFASGDVNLLYRGRIPILLEQVTSLLPKMFPSMRYSDSPYRQIICTGDGNRF